MQDASCDTRRIEDKVREHDNEMIVVADLRGVEKNDVSLQILNLRTLEISCERKGEKEVKSERYYVPEGYMDRCKGSLPYQQMWT